MTRHEKMIRLNLLLAIVGIVVNVRHTYAQRFSQPQVQANICVRIGYQPLPRCCDGFLSCQAAGSVGTPMSCSAGTLFDNDLGICNAITDLNHPCHPDRARENNLFCFRDNTNDNGRNNNIRRRAQFSNDNNFNTFPPRTTNQNTGRFTNTNNNNNNNQNTRFTNRNQNQDRFNNQDRINRNRNQNRFNQNNRNRLTPSNNNNNNNRFSTTNNNRFTPTNSNNRNRLTPSNNNNNRNRFTPTNNNNNNRFSTTNNNRFTTSNNNNNRGVFQASERIQIVIRDVNPTLRNNCERFGEEINRLLGQRAINMLGAQVVPTLDVQCTSQNNRG